MASPTILTFPSTLTPVVPAFVNKGSHITHPDLQIVFWGPYWPGNGQLSVGGIMQAVNSIVTSPYLEGMRQFGYVGPVNVRQPIVNAGNPNIAYPAPGPNVNQAAATFQAVKTLVDSLIQSNAMGDVSSNRDLLVFTFVDPSIVFPQTFNAAGAANGVVTGAHGTYLSSHNLAVELFPIGWSGTQPFGALSAFDQATVTFSHELVEAISNPFPPTGWVQTSPQAGPNAGEIGDVCNNTSCVVDSIAVQPYWGVQQGNCILPTETRSLWLEQAMTKHVPQDGPVHHVDVDLGPLCGQGNFDYVERDWDNVVTLTAQHPGYDVPNFTWSINGTPLPSGNSTLSLPATWEVPKGLIHLIDFHPHGYMVPIAVAKDKLSAEHGANVVPIGGFSGTVASHVGDLKIDRVGGLKGNAAAAAAAAGTVLQPADPVHADVATLRITAFASVLSIECGPGQGNVSFTVGCQAVENWDSIAGTVVTTSKAAQSYVAMTNQEIVWGASYQKAAKDCYAKTHKVAGGAGGFPGIPHPGDPAAGKINEIDKLKNVRQINQPE